MAPVYQCLPEAPIYTLVPPPHPADGRHLSSRVLSLHLSLILVGEPRGVCGSCQRLVWSGLVADKHGYYGHLRYHPLKFPSLLRARWQDNITRQPRLPAPSQSITVMTRRSPVLPGPPGGNNPRPDQSRLIASSYHRARRYLVELLRN